MSIIDIIIVTGLLFGGNYGFRNGAIKTLVTLIGTLLCFIIAFYLKTPIANFLSYNLPFFSFGGLTSLNIIIYQFIAFGITLMILSFLLVFIIKVSGGIEKVLKLTIVLGIPSKIIGFILGVLEAIVIIFICLFILKGTTINKDINILNNSKLAPVILDSVPGMSNIAGEMNNTLNDIITITKSYDKNNPDKFNKEVENSLLKHKIVDTEYLNNLRNKGKIN